MDHPNDGSSGLVAGGRDQSQARKIQVRQSEEVWVGLAGQTLSSAELWLLFKAGGLDLQSPQ